MTHPHPHVWVRQPTREIWSGGSGGHKNPLSRCERWSSGGKRKRPPSLKTRESGGDRRKRPSSLIVGVGGIIDIVGGWQRLPVGEGGCHQCCPAPCHGHVWSSARQT